MARNRALVAAFAFSLAFHLSMITLFQIVITFPQEDVRYFPIEIVNPARVPVAPTRGERGVVSLPNIGNPFAAPPSPDEGETAAPLRLAPDAAPTLPEISLPTLAFAELERLEIREMGIRLQTDFDADLNRQRDDSWSRFGQEVESVRAAMLRLAASLGLDDENRLEPSTATILVRPAPGLVGHIEWKSGRQDRELIYAPPITGIWDAAASLAAPAAIGFRVNTEGRVVEVLPPIDDDSGIVEAASRQLLRYRFEPDFGEAATDQDGTLLLSVDRVEVP